MNSEEPIAPNWLSLKNLLIVCGHAVYHGGPHLTPASSAHSDDHWLLQPFQKGEGKDYIAHVRAGVEHAAADKNSLLIFSGGQTRRPLVLSEAQGYHDIAYVFDFWGKTDVRARVTTEEFARDSIDNILFSIARFTECVGRFPERLSVISWAFKRHRFRFHVETLRWPLHKYLFIGTGNPSHLGKAEEAERQTLAKYREDASGYSEDGGQLGLKKASRNPYRRQHGYSTSCPKLTELLAWRGKSEVPAEIAPWS